MIVRVQQGVLECVDGLIVSAVASHINGDAEYGEKISRC